MGLLAKRSSLCPHLSYGGCALIWRREISRKLFRSFRCEDTERLANGYRARRFASFEGVAQRKLAQLDVAETLDFHFLRVSPGSKATREL